MIVHVLALSSLFAAASMPAVYHLRAPYEVQDIAVEDLDANGQSELLVLAIDTESDSPEKYLLMYRADEEGAYGAEPSDVRSLGTKGGAAFLTEFDGAAPREFVLVDGAGARIFSYENGSFGSEQRQRFASLLPDHSRSMVFLDDIVLDLAANGVDEWVIPVMSGYEVRGKEGLIARVACEVISEVTSDGADIRYRMPRYQRVQSRDWETPGLAFLGHDYVEFAYGDAWSLRERATLPEFEDPGWRTSYALKDVNGDGRPDVLVTRVKGTRTLETAVRVYLCDQALRYGSEPDLVFEESHVASAPEFHDINRDGLHDLVAVGLPFGLKNLMSYFMNRKISISVSALEQHSEPNWTAIAPAVMRIEAPEGRDKLAYALADVDGDGRSDLALTQPEEKLQLYRGGQRTVFESEPWQIIAGVTGGTILPCALNQDGEDDLVVYRSSETTAITLVVF